MEEFKKKWKLYLSVFGVSSAILAFAYLFKKYYSKRLASTKSTNVNLTPLEIEEAEQRASKIKADSIAYTLFLHLKDFNIHGTIYEGSVLVEFELKELDSIFLDFHGEVTKIIVNDKEIDINFSYDKLNISSSYLKLNENKVLIHFRNTPSTTEHGLRYRLNEEFEQIITTNFELFYAHTVFPCFDQVDLKAKIKLYLVTRSELDVISTGEAINNPIQNPEFVEKLTNNDIKLLLQPYAKNISSKFNLREFAVTERIPLYVFNITCGRFFKSSEAELEVKPKNTPFINVYVSEILKFRSRAGVSIAIRTARAILDWCIENFKCEFPFSKLDIVFVPYLTQTVAIHNAGCILIDETSIKNDPNQLEVCVLNKIIAKNVMNMWFGNSITPSSWDDLWLNDSLSLCLAQHALKKISTTAVGDTEFYKKDYQNVELLFSSLKTRAIKVDQYRSNHEVRTEIKNSSKAETNSDEITMYKGAGLLEYLIDLLGEAEFIKRLQNYVKDNVHKRNVDFQRFISYFEEEKKANAKTSIEQFSKFIENKGVVRLKHHYEVKDGIIDKFFIDQKPCKNAQPGLYYEYKFDLTFIYIENKTLREEVHKNIHVKESSRTMIESLSGKKQPDGIILNVADKCYFKQTFDESTISLFETHANDLKELITKSVVLRDLSDMVRVGKISPNKFIEISKNWLDKETNYFIIDKMLGNCVEFVKNYFEYKEGLDQKDDLFKFIDYYIFLTHPEIKNCILNYMLDICSPTSDNVKSLLELLKAEDVKGETAYLRSQSSVFTNEVSLSDNLKFNLSHIHKDTLFRLAFLISESNMSPEEKVKYRDAILAADQDILKNNWNKETLNVLAGNRKYKEMMWETFVYKTDENTENKVVRSKTLDEYKAYMTGWATQHNYKEFKHYYKNRFFADFIYVKNNHNIKYVELFYKQLNPSFVLTPKMLQKFEYLSTEIPNQSPIKKMVERTISEMSSKLKVIDKYRQNSKAHK